MKPRQLKLLAPAKLNLFLEVLRKRPDGYHDLRSVFHAIDLCDEVEIRERRQGIRLECSAPGVPAGQKNLAWRAAELMRKTTRTETGAAIRLVKKIPIGAGFGGGSSDAVAVLKGLNELWGLGLSTARLAALAAQLGSDCPFFVYGGTALCEGRGEVVKPIPGPENGRFLLVYPLFPVSTAEVYQNLNRKDLTGKRVGVTILLKALKDGEWAKVGKCLYNRLEAPAFRLFPQLEESKALLSALCRYGALMTGSGSALFGIVGERTSEVRQAVSAVASMGLGRIWTVRSFAH